MQEGPRQKVVLSDVDIPFKRALEIAFTWTFVGLVVSIVLGIGAVIILVILGAVLGELV